MNKMMVSSMIPSSTMRALRMRSELAASTATGFSALADAEWRMIEQVLYKLNDQQNHHIDGENSDLHEHCMDTNDNDTMIHDQHDQLNQHDQHMWLQTHIKNAEHYQLVSMPLEIALRRAATLLGTAHTAVQATKEMMQRMEIAEKDEIREIRKSMEKYLQPSMVTIIQIAEAMEEMKEEACAEVIQLIQKMSTESAMRNTRKQQSRKTGAEEEQGIAIIMEALAKVVEKYPTLSVQALHALTELPLTREEQRQVRRHAMHMMQMANEEDVPALVGVICKAIDWRDKDAIRVVHSIRSVILESRNHIALLCFPGMAQSLSTRKRMSLYMHLLQYASEFCMLDALLLISFCPNDEASKALAKIPSDVLFQLATVELNDACQKKLPYLVAAFLRSPNIVSKLCIELCHFFPGIRLSIARMLLHIMFHSECNEEQATAASCLSMLSHSDLSDLLPFIEDIALNAEDLSYNMLDAVIEIFVNASSPNRIPSDSLMKMARKLICSPLSESFSLGCLMIQHIICLSNSCEHLQLVSLALQKLSFSATEPLLEISSARFTALHTLRMLRRCILHICRSYSNSKTVDPICNIIESYLYPLLQASGLNFGEIEIFGQQVSIIRFSECSLKLSQFPLDTMVEHLECICLAIECFALASASGASFSPFSIVNATIETEAMTAATPSVSAFTLQQVLAQESLLYAFTTGRMVCAHLTGVDVDPTTVAALLKRRMSVSATYEKCVKQFRKSKLDASNFLLSSHEFCDQLCAIPMRILGDQLLTLESAALKAEALRLVLSISSSNSCVTFGASASTDERFSSSKTDAAEQQRRELVHRHRNLFFSLSPLFVIQLWNQTRLCCTKTCGRCCASSSLHDIEAMLMAAFDLIRVQVQALFALAPVNQAPFIKFIKAVHTDSICSIAHFDAMGGQEQLSALFQLLVIRMLELASNVLKNFPNTTFQMLKLCAFVLDDAPQVDQLANVCVDALRGGVYFSGINAPLPFFRPQRGTLLQLPQDFIDDDVASKQFSRCSAVLSSIVGKGRDRIAAILMQIIFTYGSLDTTASFLCCIQMAMEVLVGVRLKDTHASISFPCVRVRTLTHFFQLVLTGMMLLLFHCDVLKAQPVFVAFNDLISLLIGLRTASSQNDLSSSSKSKRSFSASAAKNASILPTSLTSKTSFRLFIVKSLDILTVRLQAHAAYWIERGAMSSVDMSRCSASATVAVAEKEERSTPSALYELICTLLRTLSQFQTIRARRLPAMRTSLITTKQTMEHVFSIDHLTRDMTNKNLATNWEVDSAASSVRKLTESSNRKKRGKFQFAANESSGHHRQASTDDDSSWSESLSDTMSD